MATKKADKQNLTQLRATLPAALEDVSQTAWDEFQKLQNQHNQQFQSTKPNTDLAQLRKMRADEKAAAAAPVVTLDQAMVLARRNNRVCPMLKPWVAFYAVLAEGAPAGLIPPLAIDGGAWNLAPAMQKRLRLKEQLEWADKHKRLDKACAFLMALPEEDWLHF
ncbi:hypothetical protein [Ramlibacter sp. PS4R-6]|uniref:hypothetical protein n=1 Tax=Ramlibacter sp. PS4R-6 TaxID=3133438 RepID=UPI0030B0030E